MDNESKILVVDDEKFNLDIIRAFLNILNFKDVGNRVTFC